MARFTLPRDLYHGKGALDALKTLKGKKAFVVVGGGSMKRFVFSTKWKPTSAKPAWKWSSLKASNPILP
jgi:alcohol dehydrogenase class IV